MQHVLFKTDTPIGDESVARMLNTVIGGRRAIVRSLEQLPKLKDTEMPVFFAGYTGGDRSSMAQILAENRPFILLDHAWFGDTGVRGNYFRVVADAFQPKQLVGLEPDFERYEKLGLQPIQPWRNGNGKKVLFLPHSERFGEIFGVSPDILELWVKFNKPLLNWENDVTIRDRHTSGPRCSPEEAIITHRAVVGFNTEMLLRALRMGVPAIGHFQGSVLYAFNGLMPQHLDTPLMTNKSVEERTKLCATLATFYQGSLEELATPGFIEKLADIQRNQWQSCKWGPASCRPPFCCPKLLDTRPQNPHNPPN